jgi:hypothetical protein
LSLSIEFEKKILFPKKKNLKKRKKKKKDKEKNWSISMGREELQPKV